MPGVLARTSVNKSRTPWATRLPLEKRLLMEKRVSWAAGLKFSRMTFEGCRSSLSPGCFDQACAIASHRACTFADLLCLAIARHSA